MIVGKLKKQRYQLKDFGGATLAYELKPDCVNGEPVHRICPACYQKDRKSLLQPTGRVFSAQAQWHCPECKADFLFGVRRERDY